MKKFKKFLQWENAIEEARLDNNMGSRIRQGKKALREGTLTWQRALLIMTDMGYVRRIDYVDD